MLDHILAGVFGVAAEMGDMVDEEAVGSSELVAGESACDGIFEKRNGC